MAIDPGWNMVAQVRRSIVLGMYMIFNASMIILTFAARRELG